MKAITIHRYEEQGALTFADKLIIWAMITSPVWAVALGIITD